MEVVWLHRVINHSSGICDPCIRSGAARVEGSSIHHQAGAGGELSRSAGSAQQLSQGGGDLKEAEFKTDLVILLHPLENQTF